MNELYSLQVNGTKVTEIIGPYENPGSIEQTSYLSSFFLYCKITMQFVDFKN